MSMSAHCPWQPLHTKQVLKGMYACVCYLGLLNRCVKCLSVHHSEGDALGLGRENPADDGPAVAHSDGNGAIATGLDKQLTGTIAEMRNLIYIQRHRGTTERHAPNQH